MKYPIPDNIAIIMESLENANYFPYLVGGCVRDFVMGKVPHDYDITVCASPDNVRELFVRLGYKTYDVGIKFGTVSVVCDNTVVEITPYRTESNYADSRHPENVEYVKDIKLDLSRRDFTINALAMNKNGEILDLFDGLSHIKSKTLCCVGNPRKRFTEDALRILRAIRFACRFGFDIQEETFIAMNECRHGLKKISAERIQSELRETLMCKNSPATLSKCHSIMNYIIEDFSVQDKLAQDYGDFPYKLFLCIKEHSTERIENITEGLKLSNAEKKKIKNLSVLYKELGNRKISLDTKIKHLLCDYSEGEILDIFHATDSDTSALLDFLENGVYKLSQLAISGNDIISTGLFKVSDTAKILKEVQKAVADGALQNEKEKIIAFLKNLKSSQTV